VSTDKLPIQLLEDLPATDDAFGSHQGIANAIFDIVQTEKGGRAIALAGDWGCGKSTVVKLLEKAANENHSSSSEGVEIFVFDAWAHEGDPLRRSFLERLIAALQRRKWVDEGVWQRKLEELTKKRKVTDTTSTPVLTAAGIALLILLYVSPVALALVSTSHSFWHRHVILVIGLILYALPLIFATSTWLIRLRLSPRTKNVGLLGMLANKHVEQATTEALESPEPSSVEFQKTFGELAAEALAPRDGQRRKLVLVIDNLDRVEVYDALKLWSSMCAFIEYPSEGSPDWTRRIWTLVPFDERGIRRLWERDPVSPFGEAFLAKTFQVRFAVPSPLLSDWGLSWMSNSRRLSPSIPSKSSTESLEFSISFAPRGNRPIRATSRDL
jgi:energy-coupling factor transporter ATP-binding protein EcfA2